MGCGQSHPAFEPAAVWSWRAEDRTNGGSVVEAQQPGPAREAASLGPQPWCPLLQAGGREQGSQTRQGGGVSRRPAQLLPLQQPGLTHLPAQGPRILAHSLDSIRLKFDPGGAGAEEEGQEEGGEQSTGRIVVTVTAAASR